MPCFRERNKARAGPASLYNVMRQQSHAKVGIKMTTGVQRTPWVTPGSRSWARLWRMSRVFFFNCSIFALQCCVSFCCTIMWISYMYTYVLSLLGLPSSPPPPHSSRSPKAPSWAEFPVLYSRFPPALYFTHDRVYMSMLHSSFVSAPLSPLCL